MESFLVASKRFLSNLEAYRKIRIVIGNESCDLDSAVCALVCAFLEYREALEAGRTDVAVIPLMNIPEREFRIKTEVAYYLRRHDIPPALLCFRDRIDLKELSRNLPRRLELVLVDHHALAEEDRELAECVARVIDHRPPDPDWPWHGRELLLEAVGSCATLVARELLRKQPGLLDGQLAGLLRGPILIDTSNLSPELGRATAADEEAVRDLESAGSLREERASVYRDILRAKTNIDGLTVDDLMLRDLKLTAGTPIVGLPMLVESFLALQGALEAVRAFAESRKTKIVVLVGLDLSEGCPRRDVAVFSSSADSLSRKLIEGLLSSTTPTLDLRAKRQIEEKERGCRVHLYEQGNLRATRKQILPIVRETISAERIPRA